MTEVEIRIAIARAPEEVFAFISDFEKNALWQDGVSKAWITSEGPLGVGSTYTQLSRFLGRDIEFHFVVTGFEAGRRVEFRTTSGTFPVEIVREVQPAAEGSLVHAVIKGEPGGIFKLAAPLLNRMTQRQIEGDYARLKEVLEAEDA